MPKPERLKYLIVHKSNSTWGSVEAIRHWHQDPPPKGYGWLDIGYHYVITNGFMHSRDVILDRREAKQDGAVHLGRPLHMNGAHCSGYNTRSYGICVIGAGDKYTPAQIFSLYALLVRLTTKHNIPVKNVLGHYETRSGKRKKKTCPDMNMDVVTERLKNYKSFNKSMDTLIASMSLG